ncbi:cytochrome b/b6 domain-containing protein [Limibaculum sp. FT325]|uniref:cytochrome b/b6 domain-containing protein n=1 Tax=Thermohalobaculum sediminis TaxID=2939436 RepID=UPI0020BE41C0|nr:cytochrome b/b6 domain-containing protein [Limibaculum sediminis]MCL5776204.1 cytochrome b/b6 domain-containing protein [Limibaculum sediminis]
MSETGSGGGADRPWDPIVRLTHWGIAVAVLLNGLVTEDGGQVHVWIGYAALALLALRLVWGVVGTRRARFTAFPPSLSAAREHLGELVGLRYRDYPSHNPLGSLMAYALWGLLAVVTLTGIGMAGSPFDERPAFVQAEGQLDRDDDEREEENEVLEEIHEVAANLMLVLAALHVGGVALESSLAGRNLVRPMLGTRRGGGR